jgi:hypothetical protein
MPALKDTVPPVVEQFNEIQSQVATPHRMTDISLLLYFSRTSDRREQYLRWYIILPTNFCIVVILGFAFYPLRYYLYRTILNCRPRNSTPAKTPLSKILLLVPPALNKILVKSTVMIFKNMWRSSYTLYVTPRQLPNLHPCPNQHYIIPYLKKLGTVQNSKKGPISTRTLKFRNDSAQLHRKKHGLWPTLKKVPLWESRTVHLFYVCWLWNTSTCFQLKALFPFWKNNYH